MRLAIIAVFTVLIFMCLTDIYASLNRIAVALSTIAAQSLPKR